MMQDITQTYTDETNHYSVLTIFQRVRSLKNTDPTHIMRCLRYV